MKKILLALAVAIISQACTDPKMEKVDELKKECITIHDEVMPRMGELVELGSEIKGLRKSIENDTTDSAQAIRLGFVNRVEQLDSAHEAMMIWMNEYVPDYDVDHSSDESIEYYTDQKKKITEVKEIMLKSIEDGKETMESAK